MANKRQDLLRLLSAVQATATELQDDLASDSAFRLQAIEASKQLTRTLQTPVDYAWDMLMVPTCPSVFLTSIDAGWISLINACDNKNGNDGAISAEQLAKSTSTDISLVRRFMRALTAGGLIREADKDRYAPTPISKLFDIPNWANGLRHWMRDFSQTYASMPAYFKKHNYRLSDEESVYQFVHRMKFFEKMQGDSEAGEHFNSFLAVVRDGKIPWYDVYPVAEKLKVQDDTDTLLVDVGGGKGHDLLSFARVKKALGLSGSLILQDVPVVLAEILPESEGVLQAQQHDFFTPQPVLGARAYFMKQILHDWVDKDCISILGHLRDAMKAGYSKLLINEMVVPDCGCGARAAAFDVGMMVVLSGKERTASEWEALVDSVGGLKIEKIWEFGNDRESLIEIVKK